MICILICGIDEAGRGPLIGPLVMGGVMVSKENEKKLIALGVKDSKLLTKEKREFMFDKIKEIADGYEIIISRPNEIDKAVNGDKGLNLNRLEAIKSADIINSLKPDKAIIDAPGNNIEAYTNYLRKYLDDKKIKLVLEHKADLNYPVVGAASILAKVTRDREIEKIKKKIKIDFGSGYMADPKTLRFLEKYHGKYDNYFRKSWAPYKEIVGKKLQKNLGDFSDFIEKVESKDKKIIDKLKKLEDFGYKFIPTSTEHEHVRMKGPCTITLYKSGKLLIQGKEEHKKTVEKLLS